MAKRIYVIINDGQTRWVADRATLVAALDELGWDRRLIYAARIEPDDDDGETAYAELCRRVPALDIEPSGNMAQFTWYPAEEMAWWWE